VAILDQQPDPQNIGELLQAFRLSSPAKAWAGFLEDYSPFIIQIVSLFEREPDAIADCFLYVCEQLSRNNFRRLLTFQVSGPARFTTWIRLVIRRLCIDWHRQEFGRACVFESISRLGEIDRAIFREVFRDGVRTDEALSFLCARYPLLTREDFDASCERIRGALNARQLWLVTARRPKFSSLDRVFEEDQEAFGDWYKDPAPDPESMFAKKEIRAEVGRALAKLTPNERLLIRLRYEQELTLEQVARLANLPDAQTADRRLKQVLVELRKNIGKRQSASV
jgi:RNA polymerase sigma factor (sigma-70 family)